jgi:transposase
MKISTIDLAKNVFQVHGVDAAEKAVLTRQLRRKQVLEFFGNLPACLVGTEACATAHHWVRELKKLGHDVKLIPPAHVKAYVKRQKHDAADAAAICEPVTRPSMRFVPVKTPEQQAALSVHRTRELFTGQRTQLVNALRSHLAELGPVAEQARDGLAKLMAIVSDDSCLQSLPAALRQTLQVVSTQLGSLQRQIGELDRMINAQHRASDVSRRLETVPGIGVIGATAISATVIDSSAFNSGRDLAAWIGLVPRQNSTGGKEKLGSISKLGDRYLRRLLVAGATAIVQHAKRYPQKYPWIAKLLAKKPVKVVAIAVANKTARVAWANISKGGTYRPPALAAAA